MRNTGARFAVVALALASVSMLLLYGRKPASPIDLFGVKPSNDRLPYVRAVHWFGDDWPVNFWSTDLERRATADFGTLRSDGFNTVVLLVPWYGFAPRATSGDLDAERVDRLRTLIRRARDQGLQVVLRLGYAHDASVDADSRAVSLWSDPATYAAWLAHLENLWLAVGTEPNLLFGFISWEDLWAVSIETESALPHRLNAAATVGYRVWLQNNYTLDAVARHYETAFITWGDVPLPTRRQPAYGLFLEFVDHQWVKRFFVPAKQRFAKLSMEIRIDEDPVWRNDELLRWHSHAAAWNLPGAEWVSIYWSPAMGGSNEGELLEPEEAVRRLQGRLGQIAAATGALPIFISQFLVEDYTPGFERNGRIEKSRVGEFLNTSADVLSERAGGYALWVWRDYRHDGIGNPDFFSGLQGWRHSQAVEQSREGMSVPAGGWIERAINVDDYNASAMPGSAELCVEGRALVNGSAEITVSDSAAAVALGALSLTATTSRTCLEMSESSSRTLRLSARSPVLLRRVQATGFLQHAGMRATDGTPKPVAADYVALNKKLTYRRPARLPLSPDGWMGRHFVDRMGRPGNREVHLFIQSTLPAGWLHRPVLRVSIDGRLQSPFECGSAPVRFPISPGTAPVEIRIMASASRRAVGDGRELSCHFSKLEIVPGPAEEVPGSR